MLAVLIAVSADVDVHLPITLAEGEVLHHAQLAQCVLQLGLIAGVELAGNGLGLAVLGGHDLDAHLAVVRVLCLDLRKGTALEHGCEREEEEEFVDHGW